MAKMFYTMEETKSTLGRTEDQIKQLAREGRLREFRDGPRLMFKADQVDSLKGEIGVGGGDAINLAPPSDSGAPISLATDTRAGSGVALMDSGASRAAKEDTQFADIGLSGSLGGAAAGAKPTAGDTKTGSSIGSGSGILNLGTSAGGSTVGGTGTAGGTRAGITVFDVDDSQRVDPSAQTAMAPGVGGPPLNLEGVGSGSGLLDLTRESDDTSLGAVFDELAPGKGGRRKGASTAGGTAGGTAMGFEASSGAVDTAIPAVDRGARGTLTAPIYTVEKPDPIGVALAGAGLAVTILLCIGGALLGATVMGYRPELLDSLRLHGQGNPQGMLYIAIAVGVTVVFGVVGFILGKMALK